MFKKLKLLKVKEEIAPLFDQLPHITGIINSTDNPFLFFDSIRNTLDILVTLSAYEQYPVFSNSLPSQDIEKILRNIELTVDNFLSRFLQTYNPQFDLSPSTEQQCYVRKYFSNDLVAAFHSSSSMWSNPHFQNNCPISLYTANNYSHVKQIVRRMYKMDSVFYSDTTHAFPHDSNLQLIDSMDGSAFEQWCAFFLKKIGFMEVIICGKSGDQGVDIMAEKDGVKYAIQCKCYSSDLGNEPVQEVHAGKTHHKCHIAAVITNRHFTKGGRSLASSLGVLLWDRDWIKHQIAIHNTVHCNSTQTPAFGFFNDELASASVEHILRAGYCVVSLLERELNIGYARAARIIDELENKGIVGPFRGSKPRAVFITPNVWEILK